MKEQQFKSVNVATVYVLDQLKKGEKIYGTEIHKRVLPLLAPKLVVQEDGKVKKVKRNPYIDSCLKALRKFRRKEFICIDRAASLYQKV